MEMTASAPQSLTLRPLLIKFQSLIALLVLCLALSLLSDKFLTGANFWNVLRQISVNVCISTGMTLVVLTAGIDLSVGSLAAIAGAMACLRISNLSDQSNGGGIAVAIALALVLAMALGALDAIRLTSGRSVPGDIAVIGFDDVPISAWAAYRLSTIHQPVDVLIGHVRQILDRPDRGLGLAGQSATYPCRFIERATTRPVRPQPADAGPGQ